MKQILTTLLLLFSLTISAQTVDVVGPKKKQQTTTPAKPKTQQAKPKQQAGSVGKTTKRETLPPKIKVPQPDYVDLGLSVYWASFNVGASASHEYGYYFQWADTKDITNLYAGPRTHKYKNGIPSKEISCTKYDAATYYLGRDWRIPTYNEMLELMEKCNFEPIKVNGIQCAKVIGPNGNFIILPFAGIRQGDGFANRHGAAYTTSSCIDNVRRIDKDGNTPDWAMGHYNNTPAWLTIYFKSKFINGKFVDINEYMVYLDPWAYTAYGRVIRPVKSK